MQHKTTIEIYVPRDVSLKPLCESASSFKVRFSRPRTTDPVARKEAFGVKIEVRRSGDYANVTLIPTSDKVTPEFMARAYKEALDEFSMLELGLL